MKVKSSENDEDFKQTSSVLKIETTIQSSQHLPQFLSIVPWRVRYQSEPKVDHISKILAKQFKPIEPQELRAQLKIKQ